MVLALSVVDQSPIHDNQPATQALHNSIELAQLCEQLGYQRYWIAEHHDTPSYASPCPEVLIGQIAARTSRIKVGSGGVMLSHYSPYKVAETFRMLEALYPGRIDLGFGRAPGGGELQSRALSFPHMPNDRDLYPDMVADLTAMLTDNLSLDHPFQELQVMPYGGGCPQLWTLGSSGGSVELAAEFGLGFVLALFIGTHERPKEIIEEYRRLFKAQRGSPIQDPQAIIASAVICADSQEQAELLAASHTYWKVMAFRHGIREAILPAEQAMDRYRQLSPSDQAYFDETRDSMVCGTGDQCRQVLEDLADYYQVDEIMVVNVTHSFEARKQSYRLLAQAFDE